MNHPTHIILRHPLAFIIQVLRCFFANRGTLLAGAIAYYSLLSLVPLIILLLLVLSHVVETATLLNTLNQYLDHLVPGESTLIMEQVSQFLNRQQTLGWAMVATLMSFSAAAFGVLANAMAIIFCHRKTTHDRNFLTSLLLPYVCVLFLGFGLLAATLLNSALQVLAANNSELLGWEWSSVILFYSINLISQISVLTLIYMLMPAGRLPWQHALIGGTAAGLLWEGVRYLLLWYFANLSKVNVIYGSLAGVIIALMTLYAISLIILLGAQVIAEYEKLLPKFNSDPQVEN